MNQPVGVSPQICGENTIFIDICLKFICHGFSPGSVFYRSVREGLGEGVGDSQLDAELLGDLEDRTN